MLDLLPDAQRAVDACKVWAAAAAADSGCKFYLFGSVIYKGGEQFDPVNSDVDLIAILPSAPAIERLKVLEKLREAKAQLELDLIPILGRTRSDESAVSLVPISTFEIEANVHKSGARRFFDKNIYLSLSNLEREVGLTGAHTHSIPDENRQALEFCQQVRNKFVDLAANKSGGLAPFDGRDPMPKPLLRSASQLEASKLEGEWYDTRLGLELLFAQLRDYRTDPDFKALFDLISVRRGGRGLTSSLSPRDQLLLTELLFDIATSVETKPMVIWQVVSPLPFTDGASRQVFNFLASRFNDVILLKALRGSTVVRVRSSESTLKLATLLFDHGLLGEITAVQVITDGRDHIAKEEQEFPFNSVPFNLQKWRPKAIGPMQLEEDLSAYLIKSSRELGKSLNLERNVRIEAPSGMVEVDFAASSIDREGSYERHLIDLKIVKTTSHFFSKLASLIDISSATRDIIYVVVGPLRVLEALREDFRRLANVAPYVQIVAIPLLEE